MGHPDPSVILPAVMLIVLAIVTAVVDAGGASRITSAQATLGAYRPALAVITLVSALGAAIALSGLLPAVSLRERRETG